MSAAEQVEAMMRHAEAEWPRESCGWVDAKGVYRPAANAAPDPVAAFRLDPAPRAFAAIVHSHPHPHHACPSAADMRQQIATDVPWAIVPVSEHGEAARPFWWGPETERGPLVGRPYRHGVTDCYALVRDFYGERGVDLPDYARDWDWWGRTEGNPNLYEAHFAECGFAEVPPSEAAVGDALLMQVRAPVPNHAAVIVEPGVLLHHPGGSLPWDPGRLSRRDVAARWTPYVARVLRPEGA